MNTEEQFNTSLMNNIDRDKLQDTLINTIIDGMDNKSMEQFVYDSLNGNFDDYSFTELINETKEYYPELLEDDGIKVTYGDEIKESS